MIDEENMTVWHYRGYRIRSKNDGTQYYEVRDEVKKVFNGKTFIEAIQFINKAKEAEEQPEQPEPKWVPVFGE
jgi:hypothetical protein